MHALLNSVPPTLQQATTNPCLTRDSWTLMGKSGSLSFGVTAPFLWVLVCKMFVCALQESVSPVLCKFWWFYGGVNGDLLQEGLHHTQVCCTQSPCPCSRPLLTHTFAGDSQTQFWLSLCGGLWILVHTGSVCALQGSIFPILCKFQESISPVLCKF